MTKPNRKRKPKPILHTINSGGSGSGFSYYSKWAGCPKNAALSAEHGTPLTEYSALLVGIIGHAFMELHYKRAMNLNEDPVAVRFSDVVEERARAEAERCFRAYRASFPELNHLGKVLHVERDIESTPEVTAAVGIDPYTARLDLATQLSQRDITRLKGQREIDGAVGAFKPGRYIVDHKFYGRREANLIDRSLGSLQFTAYMLAYNAKYPKQPVQGLLQNTVFKLKEPCFRLTVVPLPGKREIAVLHGFFRHIAEVMAQDYDTPVPDEYTCFSWGRVCRWYTEGLCKRY